MGGPGRVVLNGADGSSAGFNEGFMGADYC